MAQTKSATKTPSGGQPAQKPGNPVAMAKEAATMMNDEILSFPPNIQDLTFQAIQDSRLRMAKNMAETDEIESEKKLAKAKVDGGSPTPTPWGQPQVAKSGNAILDMIDKLPEEERASFIKENKDSLFGSLTPGIPGAQYMARLMNNGENKSPGMGEMAQMLLAMSQMQAEQQKNMLGIWMNLQQLQQPQKTDNGNTEVVKAIMGLAATMSQETKQREAALQDKMLEMQAQMVQMAQQHNDERIAMMQDSYDKQLEMMKQAMQSGSDTLTRRDIPTMLAQIKEVTGVELKADQNIEAQREQHEHMRRMKELELEQERFNHDREMQMMSSATEQEKWKAVAGIASPIYEMMMVQKKIKNKEAPATKKLMSKVK